MLLNIAEALNKDLFDPQIMCIHDRGFLFNRVKESGISYHIHTYYHKMKPRPQGLKMVWQTSRIFRKIAPDLIHSFNYSSDYSEPLAAKLAGSKWIFTKKNMSWGGSSKNSWKLRSQLANGIIVQNKDMITQFYPNTKKVELIPRGVKYELFDNQGDFGNKEDKRIIISIANLVPKKGIEILLRAFNLLKDDFPDWNVWVIGDDNNAYAEKVKQEMHKLDLQDRVWFSGKQENVKPYLTKAEIFVLPTNTMGEGSPVAILEAMANGKVVIGSSVPGIKDQLEDFPEHLFKVNDHLELADKLKTFMITTTSENHRTGKAFIDHVRSRYSFDKEVSAHERFYQRIMNYHS